MFSHPSRYFTDHYAAYKEILPKEKHIATKALTNTVESMHARMRHYLARLHRRTMCYSKCVNMLVYSLLLFMYKKEILAGVIQVS